MRRTTSGGRSARSPGRGGVDPVEAAQMTGQSVAVWARSYARSFGKAQRDEARARLLEYGLGLAGEDVEPAGGGAASRGLLTRR
jgi:hypothetical protein